jgi:hypothetical protein
MYVYDRFGPTVEALAFADQETHSCGRNESSWSIVHRFLLWRRGRWNFKNSLLFAVNMGNCTV